MPKQEHRYYNLSTPENSFQMHALKRLICAKRLTIVFPLPLALCFALLAISLVMNTVSYSD